MAAMLMITQALPGPNGILMLGLRCGIGSVCPQGFGPPRSWQSGVNWTNVGL
jgi:hypothetical protein